jgi:hypothetical protein
MQYSWLSHLNKRYNWKYLGHSLYYGNVIYRLESVVLLLNYRRFISSILFCEQRCVLSYPCMCGLLIHTCRSQISACVFVRPSLFLLNGEPYRNVKDKDVPLGNVTLTKMLILLSHALVRVWDNLFPHYVLHEFGSCRQQIRDLHVFYCNCDNERVYATFWRKVFWFLF